MIFDETSKNLEKPGNLEKTWKNLGKTWNGLGFPDVHCRCLILLDLES